ncbi:MAG: aminotransferase class I/II-fold pyridoxal phosphate-dependent enzyme [Bacteroidales bacterium]|nr:aminotransferase class I/II-fold pyridoxal phosphate-dependent enzyme [Bacteroidales bacterium]
MERLRQKNNSGLLVFKGTDYLGMTKNREFREYLHEGFLKYGSSFGGSRLSGSFADLYHEAENRLSKISGTEAALTFSSGTLAGLAAINILDKNQECIYAPDVHPALAPPAHLKTISFDLWKSNLIKKVKSDKKPLVILSNSLNPLKLEKYDFSWLHELAEEVAITLIIDDSHGYGVLGKDGSGIYNQLPNADNIEKIVVSSLGKAWAVPGGVVLSSKKIIDKLRTSSLFGGASPVIPAYLYAFLNAQALYAQNRKRLKNNIHLFLENLSAQLNYIPGFPVFSTLNHSFYDLLLKQGIEISAFNYPSPDSDRYTRIVLTSSHTEKEILKLCKAINDSQSL